MMTWAQAVGGEEGRGRVRGTRTEARDMGQGTGTGTREHLHVDKNNDGPSYIIALGKYQGDRLRCYDKACFSSCKYYVFSM